MKSDVLQKPRSIGFVFVDGIGIGTSNEGNPFAMNDLPGLFSLASCGFDIDRFVESGPAVGDDNPSRLKSRCVRALDANLGLTGLPQSGTGQATLFTGINCAELAGRHFGPYPHSKSRSAIRTANIFRRLRDVGLATDELAFANAFPERFFEYARQRDRWTVTTRSCLDSDVEIRGIDKLRDGLALPADLSGERLPSIGVDIEPVEPAACAHSMHRLMTEHRFSLFEYFLTDKAGHKMDPAYARLALDRLDVFISELLRLVDVESELLILTSDHGNLEDLSIRTHTRNPVPFIAYGAGARAFNGIKSLVDVVTPCVQLLSPGTS